jgi:membrane protein implicated in regulation of membrane protease activity
MDRQTLRAGLDGPRADETEDLGENDEVEVVGVHGTDLVC